MNMVCRMLHDPMEHKVDWVGKNDVNCAAKFFFRR